MSGSEKTYHIEGGKHIVLTGERGVGKSYLLQRLLDSTHSNIGGFYTKRYESLETKEAQVLICEASEGFNMDAVKQTSSEYIVGLCHSKGGVTCFPKVFDTLGVDYLNRTEVDLWVMDELGFMELEAQSFKNRVLSIFSNETPVLAVVKNKPNPFLEQVLRHPKVQVFEVTLENREILYKAIEIKFKQKKGVFWNLF